MNIIIKFIKNNITILRVVVMILLVVSVALRIFTIIKTIPSSNSIYLNIFTYDIEIAGLVLILTSLIISLFNRIPKKILSIGLALQINTVYSYALIIINFFKVGMYTFTYIPYYIYYGFLIIIPYIIIIGLWKKRMCIIAGILSLICIILNRRNIKLEYEGVIYLLLSIYVYISYGEEPVYNSVRKYFEMIKNNISGKEPAYNLVHKNVESIKNNIKINKTNSTTDPTQSINNEIETLKKLKELYDEGIITKKEFELKKKQALKLNDDKE